MDKHSGESMEQLTKEQFFKLTKKEQLSLLQENGLKSESKAKEADLWNLYDFHLQIQKKASTESTEANEPIKEPADITEKNLIHDYKGRLLCPNCSDILTHIKDSDYKCEKCEHGFSGFPPPR